MSLEGNAITEYASLSGKIHTLVIDKTLSISGAAADAKAVGDKIDPLERTVEEAKAEYDKAIQGMEEAAAQAAADAVGALTAADVGAVTEEEVLDIIPTAVLKVISTAGTIITATLGDIVLTSTADESGIAMLYPYKLGTWMLSLVVEGETISASIEIDHITNYEIVFTTELEQASWDVISQISEAGLADSVWAVGDKKTIKVSGTEYTVQIIGFEHDTKTGGGLAGITFLTEGAYWSNPWEATKTNANGWEGCAMRKTHLGTTMWNNLEPELQAVIKAVDKVTSVGNNRPELETTSDKLFLLSGIESWGSILDKQGTQSVFAGEGEQYAYFAAGNSCGKNATWKLRSPGLSNNTFACLYDGGYSMGYADTSGAVAFAFCV